MEQIFHSVLMDKEKCMGCMNCIKRCPTQAIRVRNSKAVIIKERCIDCGECIRVCPHHAKYADRESLTNIVKFKYRVALTAPSLYGQFNNLEDVNYILGALKMIGFDDVFEVSKAAEFVSSATRKILNDPTVKKPLISSACPACARLIRTSFPRLIPHMVNLKSPMEIAATMAREKALSESGYSSEEIGIFFISPCPAKITAIKQPICTDSTDLDGAVAIRDIYPVLLQQMNKLKNTDDLEVLSDSGRIGVGWASSGGESAALLREHYMAVDGIENVMKILEEIEDEKLRNIDFVEINACNGGCVGGCLTAENPYIAKTRLQVLRKYLPVSCNTLGDGEIPEQLKWDKPLEELPVNRLAGTVEDAMRMMGEIDNLVKCLPGLDCGTCGAPSCRSLSEDVIKGYADIRDCMFLLRNELDESSDSNADKMRDMIPAPFRKKISED